MIKNGQRSNRTRPEGRRDRFDRNRYRDDHTEYRPRESWRERFGSSLRERSARDNDRDYGRTPRNEDRRPSRGRRERYDSARRPRSRYFEGINSPRDNREDVVTLAEAVLVHDTSGESILLETGDQLRVSGR